MSVTKQLKFLRAMLAGAVRQVGKVEIPYPDGHIPVGELAALSGPEMDGIHFGYDGRVVTLSVERALLTEGEE